jgi:uncharacterized protein (TIGR02646 family)
MKYIKKSIEPQILSDFKNNYKNIHGVDAIYKEITPDIRIKVRSALLEEQYSICCYCMNQITVNNSHIEHIKPQEKFLSESLNYNNLLASCNGIQDRNENCGHKKNNWYDANNFLTPLNSDCEKIFTYNITGEMDATSNNGKITINMLDLNSYLLVRARRKAISLSGLFDPDFESKKQEMIVYNSTPNSNNKLPAFCMAVIYCINNYHKKAKNN